MPKNNPRISVKVPKRSGFDKSFRNSGSLQCGTITPVLLDEVIPNSRVSLKLNMAVNMPPLVSDTYMNVKLKAEAFLFLFVFFVALLSRFSAMLRSVSVCLLLMLLRLSTLT